MSGCHSLVPKGALAELLSTWGAEHTPVPCHASCFAA